MSTLFAQINNIDTNQLVDMTEVKSGSGGRGLLPVGTAIVRLASYIEFGKHIQEFNGQKKPAALQFKLGFCIVGGGGINKEGKPEKYVQEEGNFPFISTFDTAMSQHEKAKAVKYFNALNRVGNKATHFVQKVAEQCIYKLDVGLETRNGKEYNTYDFTNLQLALDGNFMPLTDANTPKLDDSHIQVFLWEQPTKEMWDSIHIEGQWEAQKDATGKVTRPARSKNFLQETCLSAIDFEGSALQLLLQETGADYSIPAIQNTPEPVSDVPAPPAEPIPEGSVAEAPELDDLDDLPL